MKKQGKTHIISVILIILFFSSIIIGSVYMLSDFNKKVLNMVEQKSSIIRVLLTVSVLIFLILFLLLIVYVIECSIKLCINMVYNRV